MRSISLSVFEGERIALLGRSGAGKSTLINILTRYCDITAGRILIDGQDVRDVTLASLRDKIAVVSQDAVIFDDTVAMRRAVTYPEASSTEAGPLSAAERGLPVSTSTASSVRTT